MEAGLRRAAAADMTAGRNPNAPHPEEAALFARPSRRMDARTDPSILRDASLGDAPQDEVDG
jgi:hypothetical protein